MFICVDPFYPPHSHSMRTPFAYLAPPGKLLVTGRDQLDRNLQPHGGLKSKAPKGIHDWIITPKEKHEQKETDVAQTEQALT